MTAAAYYLIFITRQVICGSKNGRLYTLKGGHLKLL